MNQRHEKEKDQRHPEKTDEETTESRDTRKDDEEVCVKAPEWAEHHRFGDDDQPCDDGRSGRH